MKIYDIALGNVKRRPGRAIAVVFGLAIAVFAMTALFSLTMGMAQQIEKEAEAAGTKVLVLPLSEKVSFSYGGIPVAAGVTYNFKPLPQDILTKIKNKLLQQDIVAISPVILSTMTIYEKKYLSAAEDFNNIPKLKPWWQVKGSYPNNPNEILLGYSVAQKINGTVGADLKTSTGDLRISGILAETGSQDDGLIYTVANLDSAPSLVELMLKEGPDFSNKIKALQADLPFAKVSAVRDASEAKKQSLEQYKRFSTAIAIIMALVAILIVTTGFAAAAGERTKEVGIFRAMGFQVKHIVKIFLYEALILSGVGSIVGLIGGQMLALGLASRIAGGSAAILPWYAYATVFFGSLLLAGVSAFGPAKKAAMIDPAEALRYL